MKLHGPVNKFHMVSGMMLCDINESRLMFESILFSLKNVEGGR